MPRTNKEELHFLSCIQTMFRAVNENQMTIEHRKQDMISRKLKLPWEQICQVFLHCGTYPDLFLGPRKNEHYFLSENFQLDSCYKMSLVADSLLIQLFKVQNTCRLRK
jgi:hypothetical protein